MSYKNKFLIANSVITDPIFSHSVIYLFKHTSKCAEGLILNPAKEIGQVSFEKYSEDGEISNFIKNGLPMEDLNKIFPNIMNNIQSVPLFAGGPMNTSGIFFIHGYEEFFDLEFAGGEEENPEFYLGIPTSFGDDPEEEKIREKFRIMEGVYFGSPLSFSKIVESGKIVENKFRFYSGMSSWGPGQLEHEIGGGAWRIIDPDPKLFFNKPALDKLAGKEEPTQPMSWQERLKPSIN